MRPPIRILGADIERLGADHLLETLEDSPFKHFVADVIQHLAAVASSGDAELVFVHQPLTQTDCGSVAADFDADEKQTSGTSRLESPWVKLVLQGPANRLVCARFVWNERQFLLDQALLSGARGRHDTPLTPLSDRVFRQHAEDYARTVLGARSPEAVPEAVAAVSERIPPDLLWLFQHAWQSTRGPFVAFARSALKETITRAGPAYCAFVKALVDRRLASADAGQRFESVLDLADVVALDRYRIDCLH